MRSTRRLQWRSVRRPSFAPVRPLVEVLEDRTLLDASAYLPPSQFRYDPSGFLSGPSAGDPLDISLAYLRSHAGQLGLTDTDLLDPIVTSRYTDADTGITHVYLRQRVNGLAVANADLAVTVDARGAVMTVGGGFVPGLSTATAAGLTTAPAIAATQALEQAATELGLTPEKGITIIDEEGGPERRTLLSAPGISLDDIPARLQYIPTADGAAVLAWALVVRTPSGNNWYDLSVAATDGGGALGGDVVSLSDWVSHSSYNALRLPNESPQDGGFSVHSNPENALASPFGWHDTNGVAGAEFTDTRGNNVDAHLDRDGNNLPDASPVRPNGGAALDFSGFTFNAALTPLQNADIAQVNLFYMNNIIHDIHYQYGFTEAAGNFQVNNYGRGGFANDGVQADAQDNANGGSANNANFATPPDGLAPRMQMFEFTSTTPRRDSDLDNGIIIHEYGHGVSNRLTGGPANSNALDALQSGGMGEGWSDFYALMFLQRPTDLQNDGIGMGTYVLGQPQTGLGIRRFKYSFDMSIDPLTFNNFNGGFPNNEVHNSGEIWASTLWDLNWLLINKYGYDSDLYTGWTAAPGPGHAGNKLALRLVMDAMKLQPANPSFTQARDAIIAADVALSGGANLLEIWTAFARRGLGQFAFTANSSSQVVTPDFTIPPEVLGLYIVGSNPANNSVVSTPPTNFVIDFSNALDTGSVQPGDLLVNGIPSDLAPIFNDADTVTFRYSASPVTAEGLQTLSIAENAITRISDGDGNLPFTASFRFDSVVLAVVSTTPPAGSVVALPFTTLDLDFNEPVKAASVQTSDFIVNVGSVTGAVPLDADTVRLTLAGLVAEGTLTLSIPAGALTDNNDNLGAAFAGSYTLDFGTVPYPTPLQAKAPLGSLVYDPTISGFINPSSDADTFTLSVDPGQVISVAVTPTAGSGLQPKVTLIKPSSASVSATAGGPGQTALLQTAATEAATGTYQIRVEGVSATSGGYSVQVTLNAALEVESNNTLATAQNIDGSFINLGGSMSRGAVLGAVAAPPVIDFEDGLLPASFTTGSFTQTGAPDPQGRIRVKLPDGPGNPSAFALMMDRSPDGVNTLNEAIWTVDLTGVTAATLSFTHVQTGDETNSLPLNFAGHFNGDGVAISADGTNWRTILNSPTNSTWTTFSVDLAAAAAAAGMPLGSNFKIKFQQFDNFAIPTDGRGYDNIAILVPDPDVYRFTLGAGDTATLALEGLTGTAVPFELRDASNTLLAISSGGASNVDQVLRNFVAPVAGSYYAVVPAITPYNLVVARNADFDRESNNSFDTAQPIGGADGALGYLSPAVPVALTATDSGWWSGPGTHDATNKNYFVGQSTGTEYRDYFVFDLTSVTGTITGAQLSVFNPAGGYSSPDPTETYTVFDVTTPLPALQATGSGQIGIFSDLGSGVVLGSRTASLADNGTNVLVPLNSSGVAALNAARGSSTALGGALTTLAGTSDQFLFGFSSSTTVNQLLLSFGGEEDWYSFAVNAGDSLTLQSRTPGDGSGEFVNLLNPKIELYNPSNVLVASGAVLGDGRNELISHTALATGLYRVRVLAEGGTGEYSVSVVGSTSTTPPPFQVTAITPADGSRFRVAPTTFTTDLSDAVLIPSLQVGDLQVDGVPATGLTQLDGDTLRFTATGWPVIEGLHTVTIPAGAMQSVQGAPITAFSSTFYMDLTAPRIVAQSHQFDNVYAPGTLVYDVTFDEAMATANLSSDDFELRGVLRGNVLYAPASFSYLSPTQLRVVYNALPEDQYSFTLFSGDGRFEDTVGWNLDGEYLFTPIPPAISGDGIEGGNFSNFQFYLDADPGAVPLPLQSAAPAGSLVYRSQTSASRAISHNTVNFGFSPDADAFAIDLDAGQTLSVFVDTTTTGLQPIVEVVSPSSAVVGSAMAAAAGQDALLQTAPVAAAGTYTVRVRGNASTLGTYTIQATVNAAIEVEGVLAGAANNTRATAQDVNASFVTVQTELASARRGAVLGQLGLGLVIASENFESGVLPASFTTGSFTQTGAPDPQGRIRVKLPDGPGNPSAFALMMDRSPDGVNTLNEAIWTVNLTGVTVANLSFSHVQTGDETNSLPLNFAGHFNGDGVAISADGINWRTILNSPTNSTWTTFSVDLAAAAAAAGMPLGPNFKIKFQQFDNFAIPTDGRGYDNILITGAEQDWYRIDLGAGDRVSVALEALNAGTVNVSLVDSGGAPVATGVAGPSNVDKVISNVAVAAAGAYYLQVTGSQGTSYSLMVTQNAAFDLEPNDSAGTAQSLAGQQGALGAIAAATAGPNSVVPSNYANVETNNGNAYPFHLSGAGVPSMRYQQIYSASQFAGQGGVIDAVRFRRSSGQAAFTSSAIDVTITLGYAGRTVPTASATFADNIGPGTVTVYNGLLILSSLSPNSTPQAFDVLIDVLNLFNYNPTLGDLLMDISVRNSPTGGFLATTPANDLPATTRIFSFDVNAPSGNVGLFPPDVGPYGLITRFDFEAPPAADWYSVTLGGDQTALRIETRTPGDGSGQFVNTLNPKIELYDSAGTTLLASGVALADGRNESILKTGLAAGTYKIRVVSEGGSLGEYFVGVTPLRTPTITSKVDDALPYSWGPDGSFTVPNYAVNGWSNHTTGGYLGDHSIHTDNVNESAGNYALWTIKATSANPEVFATWVARPQNATNATYQVYRGATLLRTVVMDQTRAPNDAYLFGSFAESLGSFSLAGWVPGTLLQVRLLTAGANGDLVADGVFDPPTGADTAYGPPEDAGSAPTGEQAQESSVVTLSTGSAVGSSKDATTVGSEDARSLAFIPEEGPVVAVVPATVGKKSDAKESALSPENVDRYFSSVRTAAVDLFLAASRRKKGRGEADDLFAPSA